MADKAKMRAKQAQLSHDRLIEVLDYNSLTGVFIWRKRISIRIVVGKVAGVIGKNGHRYIRLDGLRFVAHQLAWFYVHGRWPTSQIDHKDRDGDNNAITNLRESNQMENLWNQGRPKTNTSGYKGVTFHSFAADGTERWLAQIGANKQHFYLGLFADPREAHQAYIDASSKLHGQFARSA